MPEAKRVLAVGFDAEVEALLETVLAREQFDVSRVPGGRSAAELVTLVPFEVVLIVYPVADLDLSELLASVRREGSASSSAIVLVIAAPQDLSQAETYLARGADRAISIGRGEIALQEEVLRLLRVKPRLAMRVMTRLTVRLGEAKAQFLCQTQDLSRTGCLVLTDRLFPLGTLVQFSLELTDGPIGVRGQAKVVRHSDPRREQVEGLGLQFAVFEGDGETRLGSFLARLGA